MGESLYEKMRATERFNVALHATYIIKGRNTQHQECRIANLSSSGAKALFPRAESLQRGAVIVMEIAIPNTIMRIAAEAEIMWARQRFNDLTGGLRFKELLSESMIRQLVKKTP
ncbi:MAG: PilZ domain-containing protein [Deltaproteobacteria bacterium]|nr:PilZ domain-containing protein [Deltaproteobacteria bacterium]